YIKEAVASSKNDNPSLLYELEIIQRVMLMNYGGLIPDHERYEWVNAARRLQQLCSAVMAKGLEDTMFYCFNRLISLNEVGGNPEVFGLNLKDFHEFNIKRAKNWPNTMNASATHDTKRGEDSRCRLDCLSELPKEWKSILNEMSRLNRKIKTNGNSSQAPDKNDEYLIYQSIIGGFPFIEGELPGFVERLESFIVKAVREAKVHTGWLRPDAFYEDACKNFIRALFSQEISPHFYKIFVPFIKRLSFYGILNSLTQVLLKISCPGVCDIYQGTELWDLSLCDPDNRRPVDFIKRDLLLRGMISEGRKDVLSLVRGLLSTKEDGRVKQFLIYSFLNERKRNAELFSKGSYAPLDAQGAYKRNLIAFLRKYEGRRSVTIGTRLMTEVVKEGQWPLGREVWLDTYIEIPEGEVQWRDAATGRILTDDGRLFVGDIFEYLPSAMLISG
ncbi:MAG TPA: malto-oligosyltrehalose synthase, partial [Candidatus Omnitrophota bacterium]|nr:malto-oligosyltrehalose synthase [Candidatus Omnitrophota bacterium]